MSISRRDFFAAPAAAMGVLAASGEPVLPQGERQVYRHDGAGWRRIRWEDIRPHDCVILADVGPFGDPTPLRVQACRVSERGVFKADFGDGRGPVETFDCVETFDILPWLWGCKGKESDDGADTPLLMPGLGRDGSA